MQSIGGNKIKYLCAHNNNISNTQIRFNFIPNLFTHHTDTSELLISGTAEDSFCEEINCTLYFYDENSLVLIEIANDFKKIKKMYIIGDYSIEPLSEEGFLQVYPRMYCQYNNLIKPKPNDAINRLCQSVPSPTSSTDKPMSVTGILREIEIKSTYKNELIGLGELSVDNSEMTLELVVFPETLKSFKDIMLINNKLVIEGTSKSGTMLDPVFVRKVSLA